MKCTKTVNKRRWIISLVLVAVFIGFSGKVIAQTGFLKKVGVEQASVFDDDLDDESDSVGDFLPLCTSISPVFSTDASSSTVHASAISGNLAVQPPKWILNQQMKLGYRN